MKPFNHSGGGESFTSNMLHASKTLAMLQNQNKTFPAFLLRTVCRIYLVISFSAGCSPSALHAAPPTAGFLLHSFRVSSSLCLFFVGFSLLLLLLYLFFLSYLHFIYSVKLFSVLETGFRLTSIFDSITKHPINLKGLSLWKKDIIHLFPLLSKILTRVKNT